MERKERRKFSTPKQSKSWSTEKPQVYTPKGESVQDRKPVKRPSHKPAPFKRVHHNCDNLLVKKALECHDFDVRQQEVQESSSETL